MIEVGEIKASPANGIGRYKEGSLDVSAGWTINKTSGEEVRGIQINLTQIWEEERPNEGQGRVCVAMIDEDEIAALLEGMNYMLSPESDPSVTVWYTTRDSFKILH